MDVLRIEKLGPKFMNAENLDHAITYADESMWVVVQRYRPKWFGLRLIPYEEIREVRQHQYRWYLPGPEFVELDWQASAKCRDLLRAWAARVKALEEVGLT